jgi:GT2 family glycosyltransferase
MTQPLVYVVILNWNGWKDTIECLESVLRQNYSNYFVVVLDNASTDNSIENIQAWMNGEVLSVQSSVDRLRCLSEPPVPKPVHYSVCEDSSALDLLNMNGCQVALVKTGGNLGFAGGNNVGLRWILRQKHTEPTYVWLLNNDTVIEPDCLSSMVSHLQEKERSGKYTCGSLVKFYQQPEVIQALGGAKFNYLTGTGSETLGRFLNENSQINHSTTASELDYITGCSWLIPAEFLQTIGVMEERYFLYYEEIDWIQRSKHMYKITYAPEAVVYHKEGGSIGSKTLNRAPSVLSEFYMAKNKIEFMRKFFPLRVFLAKAIVFLQAINRLRQGYPKNALILLKVFLGKKTYP